MVSLIHVLLPLSGFIITTLIWFFYFDESWLIGDVRGFGPLIIHIGFSPFVGLIGFTFGTIVSWFF